MNRKRRRREEEQLTARRKQIPAGKTVQSMFLDDNTLLDAFNAADRVSLDAATVVSRQFCRAASLAEPLRTVDSANFTYYRPIKFYSIRFMYRTAARTREKVIEPMGTENNRDAMLKSFFDALRFCYVTGPIELVQIHIDREFIDGFKGVSKHLNCEGQNIHLVDVAFAEDTNAKTLLDALSSHRGLNKTTLKSLMAEANGDELLKQLASNVIWYHGRERFCGGDFSAAGILDYAFGSYQDDERGRKLSVDSPDMPEEFLANLVKACLQSPPSHRLELRLTGLTIHLDVPADLAANGQPEELEFGQTMWRFRFPERPDLQVDYVESMDPDEGELYCKVGS